MNLAIVSDDGKFVKVNCDGDLTNMYCEEGASLEALLGEDRMERIVLLNLEKVRFLDSSGISWLLIRHKHLAEGSGKLVLHNVPPLVRQPLEFTNLTRVFSIAQDEIAARTLVSGNHA